MLPLLIFIYSLFDILLNPYTVWICAVLLFCYIARRFFISRNNHEEVIVIELDINNEGTANSFSYESNTGTERDLENQDKQDSEMLPLYILSFLDNMTEPLPNQCHY